MNDAPEKVTLFGGPLDGSAAEPIAVTFYFADHAAGMARWYRECDEGHWHFVGSNRLGPDGHAKHLPFAGSGDFTTPCPTLAEFEDGIEMFLGATLAAEVTP